MSLGLKDPKNAEFLFQDPRDPTDATRVIHMLKDWQLDLSFLVELTRRSKLPAFQYGMIIAVGRINPSTLWAKEIEDWRELVEQWFTSHPDSGVDKCVSLDCRKMGQYDFGIYQAFEPDPQKNWWVKEVGGFPMTLIRVTGSEFEASEAKETEPGIEHPFWVCDREMPFALVRKWATSLEESDPRRELLEQNPSWKNQSGNYPYCGFNISATR